MASTKDAVDDEDKECGDSIWRIRMASSAVKLEETTIRVLETRRR